MMMQVRFEPLNQGHDRQKFSCGDAALDRYLKDHAGQDVRRDVSSVFVAIKEQNPQVLAFYTLNATSVPLSDFPADVRRRLPKYPDVPGILLGRLAVDKSCQGRGMGAIVLADALARAAGVRGDLGAAFVLVRAKHAAARAFYEKFGFKPFSDETLFLYMAMKTVQKAILAATPRPHESLAK